MTEYVAPWVPARPRLVVVGQSAGRQEAAVGRPFIGPAGQQLHQWLRQVGIDPDEDVMYTNVDPFFHPDDPNHRPTARECREGYARVLDEIAELAPDARCVLLLGESAAKLAFRGRMTAMHGREATLSIGGRSVPILAAFHPSYYLRKVEYRARTEIESMMLAVLGRVKEILEHGPVPVQLPEPEYPLRLSLTGTRAIDIETTGETADPRRAQFVCLSAWPDGAVVFERGAVDIAPGARLLVHNHPYDAVVLGVWDMEWEDTKMLAHLAGMPDTTLKGLKSRLLGRPAYSYEQAAEDGRLDYYCLMDSRDTWDIYPALWQRLPEGPRSLYRDIEKPLLPLWAKMTIEGSYRIDYAGLRRFQEELLTRQSTALAAANRYLPRGRRVTVCVRCGLWQENKEPGQRCPGESGRHSWEERWLEDAPVNIRSHGQLLEALRALGFKIDNVQRGTIQLIRHPVAEALLELSEVNKLLGTYVEPWLAIPEGQRFGCIWRPTGTATGRVSSARPNMQNVPRALERFLLAPEEGYTVLEFDNAQLEVRVAAHISARDGYPDDALIRACHAEDFHGSMMEAFGVTDRRLAKVGVFGTMYLGGPGAFLAACQTYGVDVTYEWAQSYTRQVMRKMPGYFRWAYAQQDKDQQEGLYGRLHVIPPGTPDERHRFAVNYPIQGGAGTITKKQMLALHRAGYWVIRQVHDSVSVAVPDREAEDARVEVPRIMEEAVSDLLVPIKVEVKS